MVKIEWAQPALNDLHEIFAYIAQDSQLYAQRTVDRITDAISLLSAFPQMGEILQESGFKRYRQIIVGSYRAIYREDAKNDRILVMGIVHASRDLPPILEKR
jgi:toxin ParE1/3/4